MNREALDDAWIEEHYGRIHRSAWMLTGDAQEAEDLTQETFLRAIKHWPSFQGRSLVSTWLVSILLNVHRSQRRALGRAAARVQRWFDDPNRPQADVIDPAAILAAEQWKASIWSQVAALPVKQQHAILLRFDRGLSFEEIAKAQGCPVGSAKTRVHYALKKLRPNLSREELCDSALVASLSQTRCIAHEQA